MTGPQRDPGDAYTPGGSSDPFEAALARRLSSHAEHGVRPVDAAATARTAAASAARTNGGTGTGVVLGRLGWLLAGAVLTAGAIGGTMWAGSHGLLGTAVPTPTPGQVAVHPTAAPGSSLAVPTAPPTSAPASACQLAGLQARVTSWSGAAGNRIARVELTNTGGAPCTIPSQEQPRLVDGAGRVLIDGDPPAHTTAVVVAPGGHVSTEVDDANYCGQAPKAPVTVGFMFPGQDDGGTAGVLLADPRSPTDVFGVPECFGPGGPGLITMHPWAP